MLSSLLGDYIHLTIQVTRDFHPVVYNKWGLPVADFDLGVSDVTLDQLKLVASRNGGSSAINFSSYRASSPSEWHKVLSASLLPLRDLIKVSSEFSSYSYNITGDEKVHAVEKLSY